MFYICLYSENMIYLLLYNLKAYSLDILYVASPSGHIKFVQIMPRGVTCKYIGLFRKNMKQSSFLKPQGLNYSLDVWYVASPFFLSSFLSFYLFWFRSYLSITPGSANLEILIK